MVVTFKGNVYTSFHNNLIHVFNVFITFLVYIPFYLEENRISLMFIFHLSLNITIFSPIALTQTKPADIFKFVYV